MIALPISPSLDAVGVGAVRPCAGCASSALVRSGTGGLFASALAAAFQTGAGKPTAGLDWLEAAAAASGPAVAAHAAGQGEAAPLLANKPSGSAAEGESGEDAAPTWAAAWFAVALPQAAVAEQADAGQPSTAPRAAATILAALAATLRPAQHASPPQAAIIAAGRQILPTAGGDPAAVIDLAATEGGWPRPSGTETAGIPLAVSEPPIRGQAGVDPYTLVSLDRVQDSGRQMPTREGFTLQLPLRASGWDTELAQRIVWMAGRQAQWAEITVNPPNLGSIEVHLSLRGHDASAYFYSPHAVVREAIDESLNRLRDMLAAAGIQLGQAQVGQESLTQRQAGSYPTANGASAEIRAGVEAGPVSVRRGLVDLYI